MGYRPKKDVLSSIGERRRTQNGREYVTFDAFLGYDPYTKKQRRMQSASRADLVAQIERFYIEVRVGGDAAARLKPQEADDARQALDLLAANGRKISLADAVRAFLAAERTADAKSGIMLADAVERFVASHIGKSDSYISSLRHYLGRLADDLGPRDVAQIRAKDIDGSIRRRVLDKDDSKTWRTYNNHLGAARAFFGWCAKEAQGYVAKNPCDGLEALKLAWKDPEYMKVGAVRRMFAEIVRAAKDGREGARTDLADAVLSFFCGMRVAEIERVREDGAVVVDVENGFVRVVKCKGATTGRRPRVFTVPEPALSWMRSFDFMAAVQNPNPDFRGHLVEFGAKAGVDVPCNAGRHTFITMHTAAYRNPDALGAIVGNSADVRARAYDGMETEANGREYFGITPQSLGFGTETA